MRRSAASASVCRLASAEKTDLKRARSSASFDASPSRRASASAFSTSAYRRSSARSVFALVCDFDCAFCCCIFQSFSAAAFLRRSSSPDRASAAAKSVCMSRNSHLCMSSYF